MEVTDARPSEGQLAVAATIRVAGDDSTVEPDCDIHMSLQNLEGLRYDWQSCSWGSITLSDAEGTAVLGWHYTLQYKDVPENVDGLVWVFSDGETGASFHLSAIFQAVAMDKEALFAFYNTTDGPNWTYNTNWLSDAPLNGWCGVNDLSGGSSSVQNLVLRSNGLCGTIPWALGDLGNLTRLSCLH